MKIYRSVNVLCFWGFPGFCNGRAEGDKGEGRRIGVFFFIYIYIIFYLFSI